MYIKATITSTTGRFRAEAEFPTDPQGRYAIEYNTPHTTTWAFTFPVEMRIVQAHRVGRPSAEHRTAMRDAGRGRLLP